MVTFKKIICCVCLVFALSACSSNPDYAKKLDVIPEEEKEPITVLSFSPNAKSISPVIEYGASESNEAEEPSTDSE